MLNRHAFFFWTSLLLVTVWTCLGQRVCQDQPFYFNYRCAALKHFCDVSTADKYKAACPNTCGLCGPGGQFKRVSARFQQPQPPQQSHPLPPELARRPNFAGPNRPLSVQPNSAAPNRPLSVQPNPAARRPLQSVNSNQINPARGGATNHAPVNNAAFDRSRLGDARNWDGNNKGPRNNHQQQSAVQRGSNRPPNNHGPGNFQQGRQLNNNNAQRRFLTDSEAYGQIRQCCVSGGVKPACMHLCRYNTTKEEIVAHAVSGKCKMDDARIWIHCAANNQNNLSCCRRKNVIACDEYCLGGVSASFSRTLNCLSTALKQILDCHREGL